MSRNKKPYIGDEDYAEIGAWIDQDGDFIDIGGTEHSEWADLEADTSIEDLITQRNWVRLRSYDGGLSIEVNRLEAIPNTDRLNDLLSTYPQIDVTVEDSSGKAVQLDYEDAVTMGIQKAVNKALQKQRLAKKSSIIDFVHPGLDPHVWNQDGKLLPEHKELILNILSGYIKKFDLIESDKWMTKIKIIGGITTYQYTYDSDIDIHIEVDLPKFIETNFPDWSPEQAHEYLNDLRKRMNEHSPKLPDTEHPVEFYFETPFVNPEGSPRSGLYNLQTDEWEVKPVSVDQDFSIQDMKKSVIDAANQISEELDISVGEMKRNIRQIEDLRDVADDWSGEKKQKYESKIQEKLKSIEEEIKSAIETKTKVVEDRRDYNPMGDAEVKFKYLQRFGYLDLVTELSNLYEDDGKVTEDELDELKETLLDMGLKEASLKKESISEQYWVDPDGEFFELGHQQTHEAWIAEEEDIDISDEGMTEEVNDIAKEYLARGWVRVFNDINYQFGLEVHDISSLPSTVNAIIDKLYDPNSNKPFLIGELGDYVTLYDLEDDIQLQVEKEKRKNKLIRGLKEASQKKAKIGEFFTSWLSPEGEEYTFNATHSKWVEDHFEDFDTDVKSDLFVAQDGTGDYISVLLNYGWVRVTGHPAHGGELDLHVADINNIPSTIDKLVWKYKPGSVIVEDLNNNDTMLDPVTLKKTAEEKDSQSWPGHGKLMIDFDNTIADNSEEEYPEIGDPFPYVKEALQKLKNKGWEIIIYSCRATDKDGVDQIKDFMNKHDLPYDDIFEGKPMAEYYIDDRNVMFTNWTDVLNQVKKNALLRKAIRGYELELDCANSEYCGKDNALKMLENYKRLQNDYPNIVSIHESEFSTEDSPYYEASIFVENLDEVNKWMKKIQNYDLRVDIVHTPDGREIKAYLEHAYWIDPNGKVFEVRGADESSSTHGQWIVNNHEMLLNDYGIDVAEWVSSEAEDLEEDSASVQSLDPQWLINRGWIRIGDSTPYSWMVHLDSLDNIPTAVDSVLSSFLPSGSSILIEDLDGNSVNITWPVKSLQGAVRRALREQDMGLAAKKASLMKQAKLTWFTPEGQVHREFKIDSSKYKDLLSKGWVAMKAEDPRSVVVLVDDLEFVPQYVNDYLADIADYGSYVTIQDKHNNQMQIRYPTKDIQRSINRELYAPEASKTAKKDVTYDYSCVMVKMPEYICKKAEQWGKDNIPDDEIYEEKDGDEVKYGRENDCHVTVLFGLHTNDVKDVEKLLRDKGSVKLKFGKVGVFENDDKPYDVVMVEIESMDLRNFNKKLTDNLEYTNDFPDYNPHMTIAYVKKGNGKKYKGKDFIGGDEIELNDIEFSPAKGDKCIFSLNKKADFYPSITPHAPKKRWGPHDVEIPVDPDAVREDKNWEDGTYADKPRNRRLKDKIWDWFTDKEPADLDKESDLEEAETILDLTSKNGGATWNLSKGNLIGTENYAVSTHLDRTVKVPADQLTADIINSYIDKNSDLLSQSEYSIGTWNDSGTIYLDVVTTIPDREKAIELAKQYNQKAIFDLKNLEEIPTGGTGEVQSKKANGSNHGWLAPDGEFYPVAIHQDWIWENPDILKNYGYDVSEIYDIIEAVNKDDADLDDLSIRRDQASAELWDQMIENGWVRITEDHNVTGIQVGNLKNLPDQLDTFLLKNNLTDELIIEDSSTNVIIDNPFSNVQKAVNKALQQKRLVPTSKLSSYDLDYCEDCEEEVEDSNGICDRCYERRKKWTHNKKAATLSGYWVAPSGESYEVRGGKQGSHANWIWNNRQALIEQGISADHFTNKRDFDYFAVAREMLEAGWSRVGDLRGNYGAEVANVRKVPSSLEDFLSRVMSDGDTMVVADLDGKAVQVEYPWKSLQQAVNRAFRQRRFAKKARKGKPRTDWTDTQYDLEPFSPLPTTFQKDINEDNLNWRYPWKYMKRPTGPYSNSPEVLEILRKNPLSERDNNEEKEAGSPDPSLDLEFHNSITDTHGGEAFGSLLVTLDRHAYTYEGDVESPDHKEIKPNFIAGADYSVADGVVSINWIQVKPEYQRKGIASAIIEKLKEAYPDHEIDPGMTTPEGTELFKKVSSTYSDQEMEKYYTEQHEMETDEGGGFTPRDFNHSTTDYPKPEDLERPKVRLDRLDEDAFPVIPSYEVTWVFSLPKYEYHGDYAEEEYEETHGI